MADAPDGSGAPPPPPMTFDKMVEKYVALRDKVKELDKAHTERMKPFHEAMATLEGFMMQTLDTNKAESMRAPGGTAYTTTRSSATVHAWSETLAWIREHDAWELLNAAVSKVAVEAMIQDTGQTPPGVKITRTKQVLVRRA